MYDLPHLSKGQAGTVPPSYVLGRDHAGPSAVDHARGLVRFVYTNNPFYVLSAWCVFWGLRSSFDTSGESFATVALMICLTGYTALLAAWACFLIRVGQVWDDVRSMLILVVLMLLATSVSLDDALAADPLVGSICFLAGLAFAILVSEGLLFGMRLRLPMLFRLPYYLTLALFFLYPIALNRGLHTPRSPVLHWALFGFSSVAGLVFLTLLPAVRRGAEYVRNNGSPWPWPWYPWVLFGVLGLGILGRAYYLCVSMHFVGGTATIFGPYFWVPFLLAVNVLVLEAGLVSRSKGTMRVAMIATAALVALAITGPPWEAADHGFLGMFMRTTGASPLFLTLIAVGAFYAVAAMRRVPFAFDALCASAAALAVVGCGTVDLKSLVAPYGLPLLAVAGLQASAALRRSSAPRCLLAACCLVAAATLDLQGTWFTAHRGLIPMHLLLASVLLIGAAFRGWFAELLQHLGAALLLAAGVVSVVGDPGMLGDPPAALLMAYPALAIAVAVGYGWLVGNRWYFASAAGISLGWLTLGGWRVYRHLRHSIPGLHYLAWGVFFFVVAMLISLMKAGLAQRWLPRPQGQRGAASQ
jgi:hypothetical protein